MEIEYGLFRLMAMRVAGARAKLDMGCGVVPTYSKAPAARHLAIASALLLVGLSAPRNKVDEIRSFLLEYKLGGDWTGHDAERIVGGTLDSYIARNPSNRSRFASYAEYIEHRLGTAAMTKMPPEEVSRNLSAMADAVEEVAGSAESKAMALLARYHARKTLAGAGLALYYGCGDLAALQMARSNAAAALEIWERFARLSLNANTSAEVLALPGGMVDLHAGTACARYDLVRLDELRGIFENHRLYDLGLDFGPPSNLALRVLDKRTRPLTAETIYSRIRGFGWYDAKAIDSPPSLEEASCSAIIESSESVRRRRPFAGGYLRGSARSTLLIDLPDGEYRIVSAVANQAELASGPFQIRAADEGGAPGNHISYSAGESGDNTMDVVVKGGRLALDFVPEPPGDWLVSGLVITRRAPRIGHIPLRDATRGTRTNFSATITAPDGIATAEAHFTFDGQTVTVPLLPNGLQYEATISWPAYAVEATYFVTTRDNAGHATRWPAGQPVKTIIHASQPAAP